MSREIPISFDGWWMKLKKKREIKAYMKEIIWADFKGRGLKEEETIQKYDEALKLFGL